VNPVAIEGGLQKNAQWQIQYTELRRFPALARGGGCTW
jgi:hypothetical protein